MSATSALCAPRAAGRSGSSRPTRNPPLSVGAGAGDDPSLAEAHAVRRDVELPLPVPAGLAALGGAAHGGHTEDADDLSLGHTGLDPLEGLRRVPREDERGDAAGGRDRQDDRADDQADLPPARPTIARRRPEVTVADAVDAEAPLDGAVIRTHGLRP